VFRGRIHPVKNLQRKQKPRRFIVSILLKHGIKLLFLISGDLSVTIFVHYLLDITVFQYSFIAHPRQKKSFLGWAQGGAGLPGAVGIRILGGWDAIQLKPRAKIS
jgi:hypothetical protein